MANKFQLGALPTSDEAKAKLTSPRAQAGIEPLQAAPAAGVDPLKPFNVRMEKSLTIALGQARLDDEIPAVTRIRALVRLWTEDEDLRQRAADMARQKIGRAHV